MKKKSILFTSILVGILMILTAVWFSFPSKNIGTMKLNKKGKFYFITGFLDEKPFHLYLDLGSIFSMSILENQLENIPNKTLVGTKKWSDINNNEYLSNLYEVDKVTFDKFYLNYPRIKSQPVDFYKTGAVVSIPTKYLEENEDYPSENTLENIDGSIGSTAFRAGKFWHFDFPNKTMSFIKNLDKGITNKDFLLENFVETKILTNSGLIVISAQIDSQEKTFILDTCADICVLSSENADLDPSERIITPNFSIENQKYGQQKFLLLSNMNISFEVEQKKQLADGILGIDFLSQRELIFDFENNKVYISR